MAVDLCRDSSNKGLRKNMNFSPRLSFSHDLNQADLMPPIQSLQPSLLNYDLDFDFCVSKRSCDGESSLADELFADGIILPIEIKSKKIPHSVIRSTPCSPKSSAPSSRSETEEKRGNNSKSFWEFTRSKSSNCGSIYKRGLLWPLPLLSRSKSTGSTCATNDSKNNNSQNESHFSRHAAANDKGSLKSHQNQKSSNSSQQNHQKPPLKKSYGSSSYRVINVPTEKLLGLASIFSHGKDKSKKK